ncbi:MAG: thioredoxin domain-containing protein [Candidatus Gastranaerophilales bacterium]|nr:thioredoxin domain-containing protein [Candidatus Gastranaerophilales bacterium]
MQRTIKTNDKNFDKEAQVIDKAILICFTAPWCNPCRKLEPIFDELANDYSEKIKFIKVNVDEAPKKALELGISGIPAVILISKKGEESRKVGYQTKSDIELMLKIFCEDNKKIKNKD